MDLSYIDQAEPQFKCMKRFQEICFSFQANLDESQMSSSPFLRALMTAVCKAAVKGEQTYNWAFY